MTVGLTLWGASISTAHSERPRNMAGSTSTKNDPSCEAAGTGLSSSACRLDFRCRLPRDEEEAGKAVGGDARFKVKFEDPVRFIIDALVRTRGE